MGKTRRILAAALAVCVAAGAVAWPGKAQQARATVETKDNGPYPAADNSPEAAAAQAGRANEQDYEFESLNDGTVKLTKYTGTDTVITVPDTFRGVAVSFLEGTFKDCGNITEITVPSGITKIGGETFAGCGSLVKVYLPSSVTSMGNKVFADCTSLTDITMPDSLDIHGSQMFYNCTALKEMTIPKGVSRIQPGTFYNCTNLKKISFTAKVSEVAENAFFGCDSLAAVHFNDTQEKWEQLSILDGNEALTNAVLYLSNGTFEYRILDDGTVRIGKYLGTDTAVTVPNMIDGKKVSRLGGNGIAKESTFENCSAITEITIPEGIISIGDRTFKGCSALTALRIPFSVQNIESFAFKDCTSLAEITMPESLDIDDMLHINIFENCTALKEITVPKMGVVGIYMFYNCTNLKKVTFPDNLNTIAFHAFKGCDSLEEVHYDGTHEDWEKLTIMDGNEALTNATVYFNNGTFEYRALDDGTLEITKYLGTDTAVTIPDTIGGKKVSSLNGAFQNCSAMTEITISEGITSIQDHTFEGCSGLTALRIPSSVNHIGVMAFADCTSLVEITLPESLNGVGFQMFYNCTALKEITIPKIVRTIQREMFYNCTNLKKATFSTDLNKIDENAFFGCDNLAQVYYEGTQEQWEKVEVSAGNDAILRAEVHLGDGSIWEKYEKEEEDYEYKPLGEDTIEITQYNGTGTKVAIPAQIAGKKVTSIGENAFEGCDTLVKIRIPDGVEEIKDYAFFGCENLTEVEIPVSVSLISEEDVFSECTNLKAIKVADSNPNYLSDDGILYNKGKTKLLRCPPAGKTGVFSVSDSVTEIGHSAFDECSKLTEIILPSGVVRIREIAFTNCTGIDKVEIPSNVTLIGGRAFWGCTNLKAINVAEDNQNYASDEGVLYNKAKTTLIQCPPAGKTGEFLIPDSVIVIGFSAFCGCDGLTEVVFPSSTAISGISFEEHTGLNRVDILSGVTEIGESAFEDCTGLRKIIIPDSVSEMGTYAFYGCTNLESIVLSINLDILEDGLFSGCEKLTAITIPDHVNAIYSYAFSGCTSLASITMPASVKEIGQSATNRCTRLKDVYYSGTEEQWKKIAIDDTGNGNAPLRNATIHFSDGTTLNGPQEEEGLNKAKRELIKLKEGDALALDKDLLEYLSPQQIDVVESYLYTWLAEINYAYRYQGDSGVKKRLMHKAGLDAEGDFASGTERAVTHIAVDTKYGKKSIEVALELGKPDSSGNLYPAYGTMTYEILEKANLPQSVPKTGQIGKSSYLDMATFISCVEQADNDMLHNTLQWEELNDFMTAGVLMDRTVMELVGPQNGSYNDGVYTVYEQAVLHYSKKVTITGPVNVYVRHMDSTLCGAIENDQVVVDSAAAKSGQSSKANRALANSDGSAIGNSGQSGKTNRALANGDGWAMRGSRQSGKTNHTLAAGTGRLLDAGRSGLQENHLTAASQPSVLADENVRMEVNGATKSVYLAKDDYYIDLEGTGKGTMDYTVEEMVDTETKRKVEFLKNQLEKDLRYEGYVLEPLGIDKDLYALKVKDGSETVVKASSDDLTPTFRKVTGLSLNQSNTALNTNTSIQLNASLYPLDASNQNLKWTTDNGSVISVGADGLITATGAGRAVVTVSTQDGSYLKASCVIVVANAPQPGPDPDKPSAPGGNGNNGNSGNNGNNGGNQGGGSGGSFFPSQNPSNPSQPSAAAPTSPTAPSVPGTAVAPPPIIVELYYIIRFDVNGGKNLSRQTMTLLKNDSVGILPKVQRDLYFFSGWFTQPSGGEQVTSDSVLDGATTLYARWTKAEKPDKVRSLKLKSTNKKQVTVRFQKVEGAQGYQVAYSTSKKFAAAKTKQITSTSTKATMKKLKKGRKYYVKVRAYTVDSAKNKLYGAYSKAKHVKVKK